MAIAGSPNLCLASSRLTKPSSCLQSCSLLWRPYLTNALSLHRTRLRIRSPSTHLRSFSGKKNEAIYRKFICEAQDTAAQAAGVTESSWKESVLESDVPVLVEFWAPWCGPCRMIEPLIDEIARQYVGKLKCFKLNTDESPQVATDYGIRSIPTVLLFKNGEKQETVIGAVPKFALVATIEKYLVK